MEISTSLLSVKKEDIIQTIYNLEVAHTDYFHIDVMDGRFVENDTSETMRIYCEYSIPTNLNGILTKSSQKAALAIHRVIIPGTMYSLPPPLPPLFE